LLSNAISFCFFSSSTVCVLIQWNASNLTLLEKKDSRLSLINTTLLKYYYYKSQLLGSPGSPESGNGSNVQDHKRLKHHTLTKNLKAMSLSVSSLIYSFPLPNEPNHDCDTTVGESGKPWERQWAKRQIWHF